MEFCEHNRIEQNSGMVAVFHYFSKLMEYICMHVCIYLCIKETWMSMYVCISGFLCFQKFSMSRICTFSEIPEIWNTRNNEFSIIVYMYIGRHT